MSMTVVTVGSGKVTFCNNRNDSRNQDSNNITNSRVTDSYNISASGGESPAALEENLLDRSSYTTHDGTESMNNPYRWVVN
jgi:hypothetical protein